MDPIQPKQESDAFSAKGSAEEVATTLARTYPINGIVEKLDPNRVSSTLKKLGFDEIEAMYLVRGSTSRENTSIIMEELGIPMIARAFVIEYRGNKGKSRIIPISYGEQRICRDYVRNYLELLQD